MRKGILLLSILMLALVGLIIPATAQEQQPVEPIAYDYTNLFNQVSPSVVSINVISQVQATDPFGQQSEQEQASGGSGFVIDTEGHIVTNNHVVQGATSIEVNFYDGTLARGEVVGMDPDSDLAVIQVDLPADQLIPVTFANSDQMEIGDPVIAIGSPFGERWTLTTGIISGLDRTIAGLNQGFSIGGVIQTDAAINPGNSGGPLLNLNGQVVGVNAQIASPVRSNSGVGFAIPSNLTQRVAQELIDQGFVQYSYLGISGGDVNLDVIEAFNLPNDFRGVVVGTAVAGGPAARAGLMDAGDVADGSRVPQTMDIITAVNGTPVSGIASLVTYLARETQPGDTVTLDVLRNGTDQLQIDVRLTPRPSGDVVS
ncbi:MAG: trypsin-like peptidase domain-containing protein [Anaerolineae bacterium]|nr:trypsin-like peptidase domain-containing protein [Anaerolineae bacterium]